jgi:hypothetical protein
MITNTQILILLVSGTIALSFMILPLFSHGNNKLQIFLLNSRPFVGLIIFTWMFGYLIWISGIQPQITLLILVIITLILFLNILDAISPDKAYRVKVDKASSLVTYTGSGGSVHWKIFTNQGIFRFNSFNPRYHELSSNFRHIKNHSFGKDEYSGIRNPVTIITSSILHRIRQIKKPETS